MNVSIIIPVKNEEIKVILAIKSIEKNKNLDLHFIVIDDNSTDNTYENLLSYFQTSSNSSRLLQNDVCSKSGAGICRNLGIKYVPNDTDYVLFFDADDLMPENALTKMVDAAERYNIDVVIGQYDYYISDTTSLGLIERDQHIWDKITNGLREMTFSPEEHPEFLRTVNYPWNKLIKYEYLEVIGLKFSETSVHNDIVAHWQILLNTTKVLLLNQCVCHHFVIDGCEQISNVCDIRRLEIFDALNDVEKIFRDSKYKRFIPVYYVFKEEVLDWAYSRLDKSQKEDFQQKKLESYQNLTYENLLLCSFYDVNLAIKASKIKLGIST